MSGGPVQLVPAPFICSTGARSIHLVPASKRHAGWICSTGPRSIHLFNWSPLQLAPASTHHAGCVCSTGPRFVLDPLRMNRISFRSDHSHHALRLGADRRLPVGPSSSERTTGPDLTNGRDSRPDLRALSSGRTPLLKLSYGTQLSGQKLVRWRTKIRGIFHTTLDRSGHSHFKTQYTQTSLLCP